MKKSFLFFSCCIMLLLSGCGQTGPLYLPGKKPPIYVPPPDSSKHSQQNQAS